MVKPSPSVSGWSSRCRGPGSGWSPAAQILSQSSSNSHARGRGRSDASAPAPEGRTGAALHLHQARTIARHALVVPQIVARSSHRHGRSRSGSAPWRAEDRHGLHRARWPLRHAPRSAPLNRATWGLVQPSRAGARPYAITHDKAQQCAQIVTRDISTSCPGTLRAEARSARRPARQRPAPGGDNSLCRKESERHKSAQ